MLPTGKSHKYDWVLQSQEPDNLSKLSVHKIKLLEEADFLAPSDKLELLGILLCLWFTAEIKQPTTSVLIKKLLADLELPYFINSYKHSKKGLIKWWQVSANRQINQFVKKHAKDLSPIEAGVLYNYPIPDVMAFMNLIPRRTDHPKTAVGHYFSKVHSKEFYQISYKEYRRRWGIIKRVSPKIYTELIESGKSS